MKKFIAGLVAILALTGITPDANATEFNYSEARSLCLQIDDSSFQGQQAQELCLARAQIIELKRRSEAGDREQAAQVAALEARVVELEAAGVQASSGSQTQSATTTTGMLPMPTGSFEALPEISTNPAHVNTTGRLTLTQLGNNVDFWAPGADEVRVIVLNYGMPFSPYNDAFMFGGAGDPRRYGFIPVYAEIGGVVQVAYAVNPEVTQQIAATWDSDSDLTVMWLVKSNRVESVQGVMVPVWEPHQQPRKGCVSYGGNRTGAHVRYPARNGTPCS